ncbi:MAG: GNAT family N-acetyltransferase [Clostridiaceae bacterium]|nr:GNAT family N-acetyltransferase [Clostridiaceae bacterium]
MKVLEIDHNDKANYMELLLIADEQISMIEKYLYIGDMFALYDDDVKSVCVVTEQEPGIYEIKNIVTVSKYQKKGYAKHLISYIADYYKESGKQLYVGTGDCPGILEFYKKCGFFKSHVVKNFFTDNYDHPMYEDGIQLVDMVYLKREL